MRDRDGEAEEEADEEADDSGPRDRGERALAMTLAVNEYHHKQQAQIQIQFWALLAVKAADA